MIASTQHKNMQTLQGLKLSKLKRMRDGKEKKRLNSLSPDYPGEIPLLRKRIIIVDYDFGRKVYNMDLFKTNRIDCYKVVVDGKIWKEMLGMSKILEGIRKSLLRVRSF